jgi:hypothetical protein
MPRVEAVWPPHPGGALGYKAIGGNYFSLQLRNTNLSGPSNVAGARSVFMYHKRNSNLAFLASFERPPASRVGEGEEFH